MPTTAANPEVLKLMITSPDGLRAALYCRVSTQEQAIQGVSLNIQEHQMRNVAALDLHWKVAHIYRDEGKSAKTLNRPAIQRLLKDAAAKKFDVVMVFRLDRLVRSMRGLVELLKIFEQHKISLYSVKEPHLSTTSPGGRMILYILTAIAEWERDTIAERTLDGRRYKKAHGEVYSRIPYGFKRDGKRLVPLGEEQEVPGFMQV